MSTKNLQLLLKNYCVFECRREEFHSTCPLLNICGKTIICGEMRRFLLGGEGSKDHSVRFDGFIMGYLKCAGVSGENALLIAYFFVFCIIMSILTFIANANVSLSKKIKFVTKKIIIPLLLFYIFSLKNEYKNND